MPDYHLWAKTNGKRAGQARDSQRQRLYDAEHVISRSTPPHPLAAKIRPLPEVADVQRRLDAIMASKWMLEHHPKAPTRIEVKPGFGSRSAHAGSRSITLPAWARNEFVMLHELAHILTDCTHGRLVAFHGREFAAVYLAIVSRFMGAEFGDALRAAFKAGKVRHRPKRAGRPGNAAALLAWRLRQQPVERAAPAATIPACGAPGGG